MAQGGVLDLRLPLQRRPPLKSPHPSVLGCSARFPLLSASDCSQLCLPAAAPDSLILCVVCVSVTQGCCGRARCARSATLERSSVVSPLVASRDREPGQERSPLPAAAAFQRLR